MLSLVTLRCFRAASSPRRSQLLSQLSTDTKQSYILTVPSSVCFDEVCTDQRHWPLGGGAFSLLKNSNIEYSFHHIEQGEDGDSAGAVHEVWEPDDFIHRAKLLLDEEESDHV